ncbi:hypothetical protein WP50_16920 [Lactiplantibacillus plantarum]|nr:hypothetical protein WP50_16920 [Lactiplantibacillus plantarum]
MKKAADGRDIRLVVVTDAEGILGMGDWGVNGVDIAIGNIMGYTTAAGIDPTQVLPVSIDAGTNNQKLLDDPLYLGNRHKRVSGEQYYDVIDKFVAAEQQLFPDSLLHFEDFGRDNAQVILDKYKDQIATFNDDIQGTGMVVLEDIEATLKNAADGRDIRLVVVTDAEGILGMGDWGVNGVDIAIGKLMVYTAAAGIDPSQVLPVSIDAGTNNQKLLDDPLYLGNRHKRVSGEQYYDVIDKFVAAEQQLFPDSLLHFEDFGRDNAQVILDKYKDQIATFNDDIQLMNRRRKLMPNSRASLVVWNNGFS